MDDPLVLQHITCCKFLESSGGIFTKSERICDSTTCYLQQSSPILAHTQPIYTCSTDRSSSNAISVSLKSSIRRETREIQIIVPEIAWPAKFMLQLIDVIKARLPKILPQFSRKGFFRIQLIDVINAKLPQMFPLILRMSFYDSIHLWSMLSCQKRSHWS